MIRTGSYRFKVASYLCDFNGKATLPQIGNFILQAATIHAGERGFGYEAVSRSNIAWVLSRMAIEMSEYPVHDSDLTVETWIESVSAVSTQRCFRFLDESGNVKGHARTVWAAISMETRRPIDIAAWQPSLLDYIETGAACPVERAIKIPAIREQGAAVSVRTVRYSDVDINRHVNSIKYMEHALDLFDISMHKSRRVRKCEMAYLAESTFGDVLNFHLQSISEAEHIVEIVKNGAAICRCRISWAEMPDPD
jgi:acyl-ACP thioesterase